jgi:Raf kinase inhibitor-like YbhB/YbcL family protein
LTRSHSRYRMLIRRLGKDGVRRKVLPFHFVSSIVRELESRVGVVLGRQVVFLFAALLVISSIVAACAREAPAPQKEVEMTLSLSSTAFKEGDRIPVKYTCDGQGISPQLAWGEPPQQTQAFVLILDDPDAPGGTFTHWVLFNLPASVRQLEEGIPGQAQLQNGASQGKNDFGRIGYGGPCPPRGTAHRYRFTLYALDKTLDSKPGASKKQIVDAMKGHILAQSQLMGIYQR